MRIPRDLITLSKKNPDLARELRLWSIVPADRQKQYADQLRDKYSPKIIQKRAMKALPATMPADIKKLAAQYPSIKKKLVMWRVLTPEQQKRLAAQVRPKGLYGDKLIAAAKSLYRDYSVILRRGKFDPTKKSYSRAYKRYLRKYRSKNSRLNAYKKFNRQKQIILNSAYSRHNIGRGGRAKKGFSPYYLGPMTPGQKRQFDLWIKRLSPPDVDTYFTDTPLRPSKKLSKQLVEVGKVAAVSIAIAYGANALASKIAAAKAAAAKAAAAKGATGIAAKAATSTEIASQLTKETIKNNAVPAVVKQTATTVGKDSLISAATDKAISLAKKVGISVTSDSGKKLLASIVSAKLDRDVLPSTPEQKKRSDKKTKALEKKANKAFQAGHFKKDEFEIAKILPIALPAAMLAITALT